MRRAFTAACLLVGLVARSAVAGPETALREFAGGQVKKGVRTIGMGGDGATTGNYALVYKDAGGAIFDEGIVHFLDTGNTFTFSAVGFTTPTFWKDAAFYVIALGQIANNARVWDYTPASARNPPSRGDLSDTSVFLKFAKPITKTLSIGLMWAFESSQAILLPDQGGPPIQFGTSYLPSGGLGLHWHPDDRLQIGVRVILNHDQETRTRPGGPSGGTTQVDSGLLRSYEYRLGAAYFLPWTRTLLDAGIVVLDRSNQVDHTQTVTPNPTVGIEQVLVPKRVWVRGGLDETTVTTGMSVAVGPFKLDLAYLYNLAAARTGDVFGQRNASLIGTLGFDYARLFVHKK